MPCRYVDIPGGGAVACPGETIREKLAEMKWTQVTLADVIGSPLSCVNLIINGKRGISPEMAHRLAAAFDTTAEFWMNLEIAWKLAQPRRRR